MNSVKIISKILYYITRIVAWIYFIIFSHSTFALATGVGLNIDMVKKRFGIILPFTEKNYLLGIYQWYYIIFGFLLVMFLYGLFFWLLSNFFKGFLQKRLFTEANINNLKWFYWGNLLVPTIVFLIFVTYENVESEAFALIILHAVVGILAFYIAAIFQHGLSLQKEQDLFI